MAFTADWNPLGDVFYRFVQHFLLVVKKLKRTDSSHLLQMSV